MDFQDKVELTQNVLKPFVSLEKIHTLDSEEHKNEHYRNKTIYSFNQEEKTSTYTIIDKTHIKIIEIILENPYFANLIKDIYIKSNVWCENQICITFFEDNFGVKKINKIIDEIISNLSEFNLASLYYRIYNDATKSKFNTKEIEQISVFKKKLCEEILGTKLYFTPYTFSRINTLVSPLIYGDVLSNSKTTLSRPNNIILYGRDIYYLYKKFTLQTKDNLLALTHCKITYNDIITDPDLVREEIGNVKYCEKKNYTKMLKKLSNQTEEHKVILTAGRNGLSKDLLKYFLETQNIREIVYIACNRKSMERDLQILLVESPIFKLEKATITDEFPNTDYNNTILYIRRI